MVLLYLDKPNLMRTPSLFLIFLIRLGIKQENKAVLEKESLDEIFTDRFRESDHLQNYFTPLFVPYLTENDFIFKNGTRFVSTPKKKRSPLRNVAIHLM